MKKILFILLSLLLLAGCGISKNDEYYKNVSDTIVSFYRSSDYDKNEFSSKDVKAIDKYSSTLTHENQEIDITDYVNSSSTETTRSNTMGVYTINNRWYIKYNDLEFINDNDIEPYAIVNCNGKTFTLFSSLFYPEYEETKEDRTYNYIYIGSQIEKNTKKYAYRSSYDGSGLIVNLELNSNDIVNISTLFENVDDFVSSNSSNKGGKLIIVIIIMTIVGFVLFSLYKIYKNINNRE